MAVNVLEKVLLEWPLRFYGYHSETPEIFSKMLYFCVKCWSADLSQITSFCDKSLEGKLGSVEPPHIFIEFRSDTRRDTYVGFCLYEED